MQETDTNGHYPAVSAVNQVLFDFCRYFADIEQVQIFSSSLPASSDTDFM